MQIILNHLTYTIYRSTYKENVTIFYAEVTMCLNVFFLNILGGGGYRI